MFIVEKYHATEMKQYLYCLNFSGIIISLSITIVFIKYGNCFKV